MFLSDGSEVTVYNDGLADRTPLLADATYYGGLGLHLSGAYSAYGALYRTQLWPYAITTKLSRAIARLPLPVYLNAGPMDRKRATPDDSAYAALLARPNDKLDGYRMMLWTVNTAEVYGEAIWVKLRDQRGRVREVHPIHPANVLIRRLADGTSVYLYTAGTRNTALLPAIPEADVVHFRSYNPDNLVRGLSPMEPLRMTLLAEDAARRASAAMWANGARPSMAVSHKGELGQPAMERLKAQFDSIHSGVDNWAKTVILEEGMTPTVLQLSAEEMQYTQARHLNREECCAAWDMPPPAVQILDRATFSNITEQFRSVYRDTVGGRLPMYEAALAHQLAPDFFDIDGPVYAEFMLDEVLRGDFEQRAAAMAQAIQTGQLMPSESRAMDNRPFVEGSDRLLVNAALIPLGVQDAVAVPTGTDVEPKPQATKALTSGQARRVLRRLEAAGALSDVDGTALTTGLGEAAADEVLGLVGAARARGVDLTVLRSWLSAAVDPASTLELEGATS